MRNLDFLAAVEMNETDRRVLIFLLIIIVILFLLAGVIGWAVRKTMLYQGKRADTMMHDVVVTHIVATPGQFRAFGRRKNSRLYFKQSLIPLFVAFVGVGIWLITNTITQGWGDNIFADFGDLFFTWNFSNSGSYSYFWGLWLLNSWPPLANTPHLVAEHWMSYVVSPIWLVAGAWYLVVAQAWISRAYQLQKRSRSVFSKTLEGYNSNGPDPKVGPLPPSD